MNFNARIKGTNNLKQIIILNKNIYEKENIDHNKIDLNQSKGKQYDKNRSRG